MDDNFKEILVENSELIIDSLLNNEILREIPILGNSLKLIRGINNMRDKAYLYKIKVFIENIDEIDYKKRKY